MPFYRGIPASEVIRALDELGFGGIIKTEREPKQLNLKLTFLTASAGWPTTRAPAPMSPARTSTPRNQRAARRRLSRARFRAVTTRGGGPETDCAATLFANQVALVLVGSQTTAGTAERRT